MLFTSQSVHFSRVPSLDFSQVPTTVAQGMHFSLLFCLAHKVCTLPEVRRASMLCFFQFFDFFGYIVILEDFEYDINDILFVQPL